MFEITIQLKTFNDVKKFVEIAKSKDYKIELCRGKQTADAKDIEQVFKLDLTKKLVVVSHGEKTAILKHELEPFFC